MSKGPLPRTFYNRNPIVVAKELLGTLLVRRIGSQILCGRIVEVEAYLAEGDTANHAFRGRTKRNASMFGPPGHAYVYAIHTHYCLNVVTEAPNVPSAVLIRAIEPLKGVELMKQHRGRDKLLELCRGPGRLCAALAIDKQLDGWDVTVGRRLWLEPGEPVPDENIQLAPRIGVSSGKELLLRFYEKDNRFVSRPLRKNVQIR